MSHEYYQVTDGEWIRPTLRGHRDQCCGCGLVHVLDFVVVDRDTEKKIRGAIVHIRVRTDHAETRKVRRKLKRARKTGK
ncbi:hypothetical protein ACRAVF_18880 [Bradyrhizobium oligotrophicum S58]